MRLILALACLSLAISGCSSARDAQQGMSKLALTSPTKKASPTSPQLPAEPASGPKCPDVDPAARNALEQPAPLPPAGSTMTPAQVKKWIEAQEGQIKDLQGHLRRSTSALSACHSKS